MMTTMDAGGVYVERGKLVSSILDTWLLVRFFTGLTQLMSISIYLSMQEQAFRDACYLMGVICCTICFFSYL